MQLWSLTPYLGDEADAQRTTRLWILPELPRRVVWLTAAAAAVVLPVVVLPLSFLEPVNWGIGLALIAGIVWVFNARTQLGLRQYQRFMDLSKARKNTPIFAGGHANTAVDDVRIMVPSWAFPVIADTADRDTQTLALFGRAHQPRELQAVAPKPVPTRSLDLHGLLETAGASR